MDFYTLDLNICSIVCDVKSNILTIIIKNNGKKIHIIFIFHRYVDFYTYQCIKSHI